MGRDERIAAAIAEAEGYDAHPTETSWWWLSFVDDERPEGDRFLGGLLIDAPSETSAVAYAHLLGLNPGGEVAMWGPMTAEDVAKMNYPPSRLLTRAEIAACDETRANTKESPDSDVSRGETGR